MSQVVDYTIINRMVSAVEKVRQRLLRTVTALDAAGVPYVVAGGNAVGAWVATVDEAAIRNTRDVDILVRRQDLPAITKALEGEGFIYRHSAGLDVFLDGPDSSVRDGVHLIFANEKVRASEPVANPDITESHWMGTFHALSLQALVRIKLTAFRDKDRTHLRDLIELGLIDSTWPAKYPPELGSKLQQLFDTPGG